jgi:hypothetical protein
LLWYIDNFKKSRRIKMKKLIKMFFVMVVLLGLTFAVNAQAMMGTFMPMPTAQDMFEYGPTTVPVMGTDISTTMPIGVGPVAMGGNTITVQVAIGQFPGPMDMYLTVYALAIDPFNIFLMRPDGTFQPVSAGFEPWIAGVTAIDQTPVTNMPTSSLPKGTYTVGLMATPTGGNMSTYYMWTTHFIVQ